MVATMSRVDNCSVVDLVRNDSTCAEISAIRLLKLLSNILSPDEFAAFIDGLEDR